MIFPHESSVFFQALADHPSETAASGIDEPAEAMPRPEARSQSHDCGWGERCFRFLGC